MYADVNKKQKLNLALNGNSFIIKSTGHMEQLVDWYNKAPSVLSVKVMLI